MPNDDALVLGDFQKQVDALVQLGLYASPRDVLQAGLAALEREAKAIDAALERKVAAALADPRPSIPAADVFTRLRARHVVRVEATEREP